MEIPVIHRTYDAARWKVYPLGDVHIGAETHDAELWEKWREYIRKSRNASMLGTGDFLNTALKDSKSESYDEKTNLGQSKRLLVKQLEPIKKRIDAMAPGNHEERAYRAVGDCPIQDVAERIGVPYYRAAAIIEYKIGSQEYRVYIRHGTGNGQSLATLEKSVHIIEADVYITAHTHKQAVTANDYYVVTNSVTQRRHRYFVSSGSFLGMEPYALARGYPPSRLGAPRIELSGERHDVHISI